MLDEPLLELLVLPELVLCLLDEEPELLELLVLSLSIFSLSFCMRLFL